jgi:steroid delta-isomerase-like uncharacterized protein
MSYPTEEAAVTPEEMKDLYRRLIDDISNQGHAEKAAEYYAEDFIDHEGPPETPPGPWKFEQFTRMMKAAFPDRRVEIDFMTVDGEYLTARQTVTGTHLGPYFGFPATGKSFRVSAIDIYRIRDGKIRERWGNADALGMLTQLGLFPRPGS